MCICICTWIYLCIYTYPEGFCGISGRRPLACAPPNVQAAAVVSGSSILLTHLLSLLTIAETTAFNYQSHLFYRFGRQPMLALYDGTYTNDSLSTSGVNFQQASLPWQSCHGCRRPCRSGVAPSATVLHIRLCCERQRVSPRRSYLLVGVRSAF